MLYQHFIIEFGGRNFAALYNIKKCHWTVSCSYSLFTFLMQCDLKVTVSVETCSHVQSDKLISAGVNKVMETVIKHFLNFIINVATEYLIILICYSHTTSFLSPSVI
jgi:hypothetical protein